MRLSARAIALQGFGFTPLLVAVQGFGNASPFTRAPKGGGFGPRPSSIGMRPRQESSLRPRQNTTYRR